MKPPKPYLFIGSATESTDIAREIELQLQGKARIKLWKNETFGLGQYSLEALLDIVDEFDFAIFVFSPDDTLIERGKKYSSTRDNVIFELGLFMAKLGRRRTIIVKDNAFELKLPSDLDGVTTATYKREGKLCDDISPISTQLIKNLDAVGFNIIAKEKKVIEYSKNLKIMAETIIQEYIDGIKMNSWEEIYKRACKLVNEAERRVRSTSFGIGKWQGDDSYVKNIAYVAKKQKDKNVDFCHKVVFGSTLDNKHKRQLNIKKRKDIFESAGVSECLQIREIAEVWGVDILIIDDKHLHLSFQRASGDALVFGVEIRNHPELARPLTEWFDEGLFSVANVPDVLLVAE